MLYALAIFIVSFDRVTQAPLHHPSRRNLIGEAQPLIVYRPRAMIDGHVAELAPATSTGKS
jgi:hypothetical protein